MEWDFTLHLGDVLMAVVTVVLIPVIRFAVQTLLKVSATMSDLSAIVLGHERYPESGLVHKVGALETRLSHLETERRFEERA